MAARRAPSTPRAPRQARSRQTVDAILEAATRVFRREGFGATTNRVAAEAGVSIGSLYEYFADKHALLVALATRHVALAETEIALALEESQSVAALLERLQRAILASQRYPSEALALLSGPQAHDLQARVGALREQTVAGISALLLRLGHPAMDVPSRAQAVFGVIGELTVHAWLRDPDGHRAVSAQLLEMAVRHCALGTRSV